LIGGNAMTPAVQPQKRFGWVKWALLIVVLLVGLPAGCSYWLFGFLANNEAAKLAVLQAEQHPAVAAKLGTPLKVGRFASGSINVSGTSGDADLALPVSGPKGAGTLYVKATRTAGRWNIELLQLAPDDGSSRINVVPGGIRS
jgi:hypothetical protein